MKLTSRYRLHEQLEVHDISGSHRNDAHSFLEVWNLQLISVRKQLQQSV